MNTSRSLGLGAGAVLLLLAGCGSSSSSSSASTAASSASSSAATDTGSGSSSSAAGGATQVDSAYAQQANAICATVNSNNKSVSAPAGDPTMVTADQLPAWGSYFDKINPPTEDALAKLKALPPPSQGAAGLTDALARADALAQDAVAAQTAAKGGDLSGFKSAIGRLVQDNGVANSAFDAIGLKTCGSGS